MKPEAEEEDEAEKPVVNIEAKQAQFQEEVQDEEMEGEEEQMDQE